MTGEPTLEAQAGPPAVSVVMPARDAERFIAESVGSVLAEAGVPLELVVVDDRSSDGTAAVLAGVRDPRLRVVTGPGDGIATALNAGVAAARGRFVARCDADDLFVAGRLGPQLQLLRSEPDAAAVAGGYASMDARGREVCVMSTGSEPADLTEELLAGRTRTHLGAWLIRRSAWEAIGGARAWFQSAEDLDLQCRLAGVGRVLYRPGVAYRYRLHGGSVTHRITNARRRFFDAAVVRFAQQRAAGEPGELERGEAPDPPEDAPDCAARMSPRWQTQGLLMYEAHRARFSGDRGGSFALLRRAFLANPAGVRRWPTLLRQTLSLLLRPTHAPEQALP